jgi:hypothetical protein
MVDARVELGEQGWRFWSGLHRVFLRLAGRVPDDWLTHVRGMLAGGDLPQLPDIVSGSMVELGVPLAVGEVALLREIRMAFFDDPDPVGVDMITLSEDVPETAHRFFPVPADVLVTDAARIPARLDLTGRPSELLMDLPPGLMHLDDLSLRMTDGLDNLLVPSSDDGDLLSIARAWRFPPDGSPDDGVRVVLAEVAQFAPAWDVTGKLQRLLGSSGVPNPQVEVFWTGMELPPYHRAALDGSALFWSADA